MIVGWYGPVSEDRIHVTEESGKVGQETFTKPRDTELLIKVKSATTFPEGQSNTGNIVTYL